MGTPQEMIEDRRAVVALLTMCVRRMGGNVLLTPTLEERAMAAAPDDTDVGVLLLSFEPGGVRLQVVDSVSAANDAIVAANASDPELH